MNTGQSWGGSSRFGTGGITAQAGPNSGSGGLFGNSNAPANAFQSTASNTNSQPSTAGGLFGSRSTSSTFGNLPSTAGSTSFSGNAATMGSAAQPGLFGNSSTANTSSGGLFGNSSTANTSSGALFGNKAAPASSGVSFGNSNGPSASSGGLFGNSSTGNASGGGLFGNSNTNTGSGLFGNTGSNNANTGAMGTGLFGKSDTNAGNQSTGLFKSATETKPSSGLFGNSSQPATNNAPSLSGSLFGNSSTQANTGLFGASNKPATGSLFGNSSSNTAAGASGGLFGNKASGGGVFPTISTAPPTNASNPYGTSSILNSISTTENNMPPSITSPLLGKGSVQNKKRSFSAASMKSDKSEPSLLSKLAQRFNIFRAPASSVSGAVSKPYGIFKSSNRVEDLPVINMTHFKARKQDGAQSLSRSVGDIRRLVIKSTPTKFHLIDTEKVFNAKRRQIQDSLDLADMSDGSLSDEEIVKTKRLKLDKTDTEGHASSKEAAEGLFTGQTKDGYFCSPSLQDLVRLSPVELSEVSNLIIGRVGHGQVSYMYPVDLSLLFERLNYDVEALSNELFGKIVKFENSIVRVYDDEDLVTPALGLELNVPATVTLKVPLKKGHSLEEQVKRLKDITGMEFVTYDPISENWVSFVKHFSVWGLIDDSEDEGDESIDKSRLRDLKKKQDEQEADASAMYSRLYENESYHNELKRQRIEGQTSGIPGGWEFNSAIKENENSLDIRKGLVEQEISQELNAFKENKFALALAANASDITNDSDSESIADSGDGNALDRPLFPDEPKNYDYIKDLVVSVPNDVDMDEIVDEKAYEPQIDDETVFAKLGHSTSLATSKSWVLQLELANDVNSALAPFLSSEKQSRSVLDTINDILFSGFEKSPSPRHQASTPKQNSPEPRLLSDRNNDFDKVSTAKSFQSMLLKSGISTRENSFPQLSFTEPISFAPIWAIFKQDPDSDLLELATILFDSQNISSLPKYSGADFTNMRLIKRLELLEKRTSLAAWLKKFNAKTQLSVSSDSLDRVFAEVCFGNLKSAIELALSSNNSHLASMLTLMDSNDPTVRALASGQLEYWKSNGDIEFIPLQLIKVFRLLEGNYMSFYPELPYNIVLGLIVFYGNSAEGLEAVFSSFGDVSAQDALKALLDIYRVMKLNDVNTTTQLIENSRLSRKLKWLLVQLLPGIKSSQNHDQIAVSYGTELESAGLWKEAIYVYASITSDSLAESRIRDVVIANVDEITPKQQAQEEFLVTVLKVPRNLVYEALAIDHQKRGNIWDSAEAYVVATLWEEAHTLICDELGPSAVIQESAASRNRFRALAKSFPEDGGVIPNWNQGAGFYMKYLDVAESSDDQLPIETQDINFLLNNAIHVHTRGFTGSVAAKIMMKTIADIALDNREGIQDLQQKINSLHLGENERDYIKSRLASIGLQASASFSEAG